MKLQGIKRYAAYKDSGIEWLGEVPAHWLEQRVKDIALLERGKFTHRPRNDPQMYDGEYPFIQTGDVARANKYVNNYKQTLSDKGTEVSKKFKKGTLLMAIAANIGDVAILGFDSYLPDSVVGYKPKKTDTDYLFYLFTATKIELNRIKITSTQDNLNLERLNSLIKFVPPFPEQQAIAAYLDTQIAQIDRKIDLLSQKASQYGKLKQSLINETVTRGLDKTVPMKDSGVEWIGEVPSHWEVKRLKDINNIIMGQSPSSSDYTDQNQGYPFLQGNAEFGHYSPTPKVWCSVIKKFAVKNDVLLSVRAPVGAVNVAEDSYGIGRGLCAIRTKSNHQFWYYFSKTITAYLNSIATGSTYLAVSVEDVRNTMVILPSNQEQLSISNYLDEKTAHIDRIVATINSQIGKLKELRLSLINDIVTGKIKITNEVV